MGEIQECAQILIIMEVAGPILIAGWLQVNPAVSFSVVFGGDGGVHTFGVLSPGYIPDWQQQKLGTAEFKIVRVREYVEKEKGVVVLLTS